ncbi:MAG: DUF5655 domain-containing protein [Planctomycetales bacterium]|nr:DUF5655 domain-containing protein [Planctomycetales bacterium]
MASKKSGGAVATKKKPTASLKSAAKRPVKPAVAKKAPPKAVAPASKPTKAPAKKALTITVVKKPVAPPVPVKPVPTRSLYSVHPSVSMMQRWIAELKEKTGKNLDEWVKFVRASGPSDLAARRIWLKDKHKLGTNSAWWIAERADVTASSLVDDDPQAYLAAAVKYVEEMYAGAKSGLKPLHDRLLEIARVMGRDVRVCPCKTIVPIYRRHVIAQIFPAGRTRIDFGLALRDTPASGRLIETGGWEKKDRITHRIPITSLAEIDSEVERWLRFAYELDA